MERFGLLKNDKMGEYEKQEGFASYKTLVDFFIGDIVLCNNIVEIDASIYDNLGINVYTDIYQFYLCNLSGWQQKEATKAGLILSYSDLLGCDVLCVDHWGTSWDYVLTSVKLFDDYEELQKWENGNNEE